MKDNRFLALRRSEDDDSRPGKWDICGGSLSGADIPEVESGEDLILRALKRELLEEVGFIPEKFKLLHVSSRYKYKKERLHVGIGFLGIISGPVVIKLSEEHIEYAWLDKEDFGQLDFGDTWVSEAIKEMLKEI